MASAHDVAAYILAKTGPITAMKLQKLLYYCQAWSLVWDDQPMFRERIEAWANGPVIPTVYDKHRGKFKLTEWPNGQRSKVAGVFKETVNAVLEFYGKRSSQWLSNLTHQEPPWKDARQGLPVDARGNKEITHASMAEYYGSLL